MRAAQRESGVALASPETARVATCAGPETAGVATCAGPETAGVATCANAETAGVATCANAETAPAVHAPHHALIVQSDPYGNFVIVKAPAGRGTVDVRIFAALGESPVGPADRYTYGPLVHPRDGGHSISDR
jgi:hypothetical protein